MQCVIYEHRSLRVNYRIRIDAPILYHILSEDDFSAELVLHYFLV